MKVTNHLFFCCYFFPNAADDMGLGKTLTMISLILTKKISEKGKDDKKEVKRPEKWISKTGNYIFHFSLLKQTKRNHFYRCGFPFRFHPGGF